MQVISNFQLLKHQETTKSCMIREYEKTTKSPWLGRTFHIAVMLQYLRSGFFLYQKKGYKQTFW
jgi:hypothetical protein